MVRVHDLSRQYVRRKSRQLVGLHNNCHFQVDKKENGTWEVSSCNFTLSSPLNGIYSWKKGIASESNWLGGPPRDASNSTDGKPIMYYMLGYNVYLMNHLT